MQKLLLPLLHGLEGVVVTQGPYCIWVQLTVPLTDSTGWLKECVAKHQCWIFPISAKTGGFEFWSLFKVSFIRFHLSRILQETWLKLAVLVIVKQVLFVCLGRSLLTVTECKSFKEVQQILGWYCILHWCQKSCCSHRCKNQSLDKTQQQNNFLGMKLNDGGFCAICPFRYTMLAWCTSHFMQ